MSLRRSVGRLCNLGALIVSTLILEAAPVPADIEQMVTALLARMTLDEKIGQMSQSTSMKSPLSAEIGN